MTTTKGVVVPAGGGKHLDMSAPGRFAALKLLGVQTNQSIMLFEETVPTPASAGDYVEALLERPAPLNDDERTKLRERYHWEVVGPNPL